ncbi:hypothetical protein GSI_03311 [Ganoderma sinense ZZ0214-1]|uniref:Uncharacterized protein n=1 Tax=Ganoderma sinense ZZ0214-1 TaxID=1077348 RepID=A0A2G8SLB5_9APHY|nr:hypothetical protein GSI_03311 [Ganoderma sinense ZZ0214-1]
MKLSSSILVFSLAMGAAASSFNAKHSACSSAATSAVPGPTVRATKGSNKGASGANEDPQTSLTLLPSVIAHGFENDGQDAPEAGQDPSLTSPNNFINFCATVPSLPLTNGKQIKTGSCNPAPMGVIAAITNMPSSKFVFPTNGAKLKANTDFTIAMAIRNFDTGFFVNPEQNFLAAPQQVDACSGNIKGNSHFVIEQLASLDSTTPTDPRVFAFFKGLNNPADSNGHLTADVPAGLPAGTYRLASINTAANHQPALVPVAQHGTLDDMVYMHCSILHHNSIPIEHEHLKHRRIQSSPLGPGQGFGLQQAWRPRANRVETSWFPGGSTTRMTPSSDHYAVPILRIARMRTKLFSLVLMLQAASLAMGMPVEGRDGTTSSGVSTVSVGEPDWLFV